VRPKAEAMQPSISTFQQPCSVLDGRMVAAERTGCTVSTDLWLYVLNNVYH
jgi:hypothetical protein